jgi:hypothetical protein
MRKKIKLDVRLTKKHRSGVAFNHQQARRSLLIHVAIGTDCASLRVAKACKLGRGQPVQVPQGWLVILQDQAAFGSLLPVRTSSPPINPLKSSRRICHKVGTLGYTVLCESTPSTQLAQLARHGFVASCLCSDEHLGVDTSLYFLPLDNSHCRYTVSPIVP